MGILACSNLSTRLLKSTWGSRTNDGLDALFFLATFLNFGVKVIIRNSVIFFVFVVLFLEKLNFLY